MRAANQTSGKASILALEGKRSSKPGARTPTICVPPGGPRGTIGMDEGAAEDGSGAHHAEEVGADVAEEDQVRRAVFPRHGAASGGDGGDFLKDGGGAVAEIEKIGIGEEEVFDAALAHVGGSEDEAVRPLVRKG